MAEEIVGRRFVGVRGLTVRRRYRGDAKGRQHFDDVSWYTATEKKMRTKQ